MNRSSLKYILQDKNAATAIVCAIRHFGTFIASGALSAPEVLEE